MKLSNQLIPDKSIQQLLNQELKAEAELLQMDKNIQALENKVIAQDWWDGNFIIRWSRHLNQQKDHPLHLHPKDRWFAVSSITSPANTGLLRIEDQVLNNNQTHSKTDARKKFIMKPKNRKEKEVRKIEMYERKQKKVNGKRRRNKNKKRVDRRDEKKQKVKKRVLKPENVLQ